MNASDLGRLLGDRAIGAKVMSGSRELSKSHIKVLADRFAVSRRCSCNSLTPPPHKCPRLFHVLLGINLSSLNALLAKQHAGSLDSACANDLHPAVMPRCRDSSFSGLAQHEAGKELREREVMTAEPDE